MTWVDPRSDEELAADIAAWKADINPLTGKPYGLRAIAYEEGITYGKARYVDNKYNKHVDKYHPEYVSAEPELTPVRAFVWDLETTNLNTFMGQLIVASFLDLTDGMVHTKSILDYDGTNSEKEQELLLWVVDMLHYGDIFIGHNTLAFDLGFLRGRLAIHDMDVELPKRQHWDTYQIARHGAKIKPQGYSLENLADFFRLPVGKDKPSKHDWAASIILDPAAIERIIERCEADVLVNALLWTKMRRYQHSWKGR